MGSDVGLGIQHQAGLLQIQAADGSHLALQSLGRKVFNQLGHQNGFHRGLIDGLWDHRIADLITSPDDARLHQPPAFRLVEEALENSGRDNITAVVFEIAPPATPASVPVAPVVDSMPE